MRSAPSALVGVEGELPICMIGVILVFVNSSSSVYVKIFMLGAMSLASLILF